MNRRIAIFLVGCSLLINACATHTRAATPVALTITSDTANDRFVQQVRNAALDAIAAQVPNPHPMTIAVDLVVATQPNQTAIMGFTPPVNQQRTVTSIGPQPWTEGAQPTVPVNSSPVTVTGSPEITTYRVSYTISDTAGKVLERNQLTLDQGRLLSGGLAMPVKGRIGLTLREELVNSTAAFLASRVKTLSR
jgi:hypothetical protein